MSRQHSKSSDQPVPAALLTLGVLAHRAGVREYHIRQLAKLGRIPFQLAGRNRVFKEADLPRIREVCIIAGYLAAAPEIAGAR